METNGRTDRRTDATDRFTFPANAVGKNWTTTDERESEMWDARVAAIHVTGSEYVARGSPIQLVCNATTTSLRHADVDWFKDGRLVVSDAQTGLVVTKKTDHRSTLVSVLAMWHTLAGQCPRWAALTLGGDHGGQRAGSAAQ